MKIKKKTAKALESRNGHINKKLSVVKYNTPFKIEQRILPHTMGVCIENQQKQKQCLYCLQWFDRLPVAAIYADGTLRGIFIELCGICGDLADALGGPATDAQRNFWRTVKINLAEAAEVDADIINEVRR